MASFDRWCVRGKAIKNRICITDTYISLGLYAFYFWIYTSNISLAHIYTSHIILRHPQVTYTHLGNMAVGRGSIATRSLSKSAFICTSNAVVNFLRPLVYWQKLTILHMTLFSQIQIIYISYQVCTVCACANMCTVATYLQIVGVVVGDTKHYPLEEVIRWLSMAVLSSGRKELERNVIIKWIW